MSDKELLAEAREACEVQYFKGTYQAGLMERLADALEARQPSEGKYILKLIESVKGSRSSVEIDGVKIMPCDEFGRTTDVPDAATEGRMSLAELEDIAETHAFCADRLFIETELVDEIRAERDAALAALDRVRAVHRKLTYYELEDSCPDTSKDHREERHHESDEIGEFYCEDMPTGDVVCDLCRDADGERMDWPCPTVAALDGAPEHEMKP